MEKKLFCQCCAMPMDSKEVLGTNKDGSKNSDYCIYCYKDGEFTAPDVTMEEEIEICVPFMKDQGFTEEQARKIMQDTFPHLKRWAK